MSRRTILLCALGACALATSCEAESAAPATVHFSGTAYRFNSADTIAGAVVALAEFPEMATVTAADGSWEMDVPNRTTVTPFVTLDGYVPMYLQTFATRDEDLERIYFQMVNEATYDLLAQVLGVVPDGQHCQVATTVSEKIVQTMTFDEFSAHGAHGVAGATVTTSPSTGMGAPVYFNEQVLPDASRTETSRDGGVVWVNIEPGVYELIPSHPERRFARATVTCEAGRRLINASPPWGLREL